MEHRKICTENVYARTDRSKDRAANKALKYYVMSLSGSSTLTFLPSTMYKYSQVYSLVSALRDLVACFFEVVVHALPRNDPVARQKSGLILRT